MIGDALSLLAARPAPELAALFWFVLLFDVPRYFVGFMSVFTTWGLNAEPRQRWCCAERVSVLIAGYNEEDSFTDCVLSLHRQGIDDMEIICVDDGSTDRTGALLRDLHRQGLIDKVVSLASRSGKSAALNLAARLATGQIFVVVDCDCVLEPTALRQLLSRFEDPGVGAVAGSVLVRNARASNVASLQALEYLFSIHLGRTLLDYFDLVTCVSGAFGAFRSEAWEAVGGMDPGPGEDFDATLRLRQHGYRIRFAPDAVIHTDVPETFWALMHQRNRWERDAFRIRMRKFGFALNPFDRRFRLAEAVHQVEFLLYDFLAALLFIVYLVFLAVAVPLLAPTLLLATGVVLLVLDGLTLAAALVMTGRTRDLRLFLYLPLFVPFQGAVMRFVRLYAYLDELVFDSSRHDDYVPEKVRSRVYRH